MDGYRAGEFTPVDMLDSVSARIGSINARLNAIVTHNPALRTEAERSARRWKNGEPTGTLDGVCISVKDNIPVAGLRCTWGSKAYSDFVPDRDESPIAHLRDGGVLVLGKTNAPEFTLQGYTDNLVFGATGNPWAPELTPGGSSGGAVAAVASGMGAAAIGTDGGGSIRRPCAHTGLYGLKPSPGFVGRAHGLPALLRDFETMGPIARCPGDLRHLLAVMARWHPWDRSSYAFDDASRQATPDVRSMRILLVRQFADFPVDPEIRASVAAAAQQLQSMGHEVEEGPVPFDVDELNTIWNLIGPAGLACLVDNEKLDTELLNPSLLGMIEAGRTASASAYVDLLARVDAFRAKLAELFERIDVVMTPSIAALSWPKRETHPEFIDGTEAGPRGHAVFTPFANAGGLPAVNIPTAPSASGLPIGAQLVGRFGADLEMLALAETYETEFGRYQFPEIA